jgi:hypothetical protein
MSQLNSVSQEQRSMPGEKFYNVHLLSDDEQKKIPLDEKQELVSQPGEPGSIWETVMIDGKNIGSSASVPSVEKNIPYFAAMLKSIDPTVHSHLAFGDFKYAVNHKYNKVFRNAYNKAAQPWTKKPGGGTAYHEFVQSVFVGTPDEVNDFLDKDENRKKWKIMGDWKIDSDRYISIGLYKPND